MFERRTESVAAVLAVFLVLAVGILLAGTGTAKAYDEDAGTIVEHTVQDGDNLSLIAGYYYKDPRQWKRIFHRNKELISDPDVIQPGTVLNVMSDSERPWQFSYSEFRSRIFN